MAKRQKLTRQQRRLANEQKAIDTEAAYDREAGKAEADAYRSGVGARTAEEQAALDARKADYEKSGQMTDEQKAAGERLKYDPRQDPETLALMEKHKAGLEGYTAEENQALRGQMYRAQQSGQAGALRGMRAAMGSAGVTGQAAAGNIGNVYRSQLMARAMGESQLLTNNIAEKGRRLDAYSNYLGGVTGQSVQAAGQYGQFANQMQSQLSQDRLAAADRYTTDTLAQNKAEREGYMQQYLGGIGLNVSRRGANRGDRLAQQGLAIARNAYQDTRARRSTRRAE